MNRIVVDQSVKNQLQQASGPCEVFDSAGHKLGLFRPEIDRSVYGALEPSVSDVELTRREMEGGGRTLKRILDDLEKSQG
jgi:hypothetical protein